MILFRCTQAEKGRTHASAIARQIPRLLGLLGIVTMAACGSTISPQSGSGGAVASTPASTPAVTPGVTPGAAPAVTLSVLPTTVYAGSASTIIWTATNVTGCTASGGWSGSKATSGTGSTGAVTTRTSYTLTCNSASGTSISQSTAVSIAAAGAVTRPAANTGDGFFVLNGKVYDPNGNEFRIRGVNRAHYDGADQPGISLAGANAVRFFMALTSVGAAAYAAVAQNQHIDYKEVPIITMPWVPDGTTTSCNNSTSVLAAGVAWWVANAATFTPLNRYMIINVANEWGPGDSTVWRDAYISAIASLRGAGYLGPLLIDSGGCGQDINDLLNYSTAVFNSDPQRNVIFALHIYGGIPTASVAPYLAQLAALGSSAGMAFVVGEFGPGLNFGPSPTLTTPADVITAAEVNGIGWLAWAWDDNTGNACQGYNGTFDMTLKCGVYTQPSDLTSFGQDVVLNPIYGIKALARPASIF